MQIQNFEIFNNQELRAFKEINGNRIEIMDLKEIKLEPIVEKILVPVIGSERNQYKTNYIGLSGQAKVNSISYKGKEIISNSYENLEFILYKDGIILQCCIEDAEDILEGDYINFTTT